MFNRRTFLKQSSTSLLLLPSALAQAHSLRAQVVIIGAGVGGCAAALAALRNGMTVIMTEETDWVGGQLTSQAVPPDEHPWIEQFGGTQLYRRYRSNIRQYYRQHYRLMPEAHANEWLNPGGGSVSKLTHEPRVSLAVLEQMLSPYIGGGQLTMLLQHKSVRADVTGDKITAVAVKSLTTGQERTLEAPVFIDATEQGDLLPLSKTEYVTGFESRKSTGELHAPEISQPANIQSFTVCFAIGYEEGRDHTIPKPKEYSFWRDYVPAMKPAWPGKLLSWSMSNPTTLAPRAVTFDPRPNAAVTPGVLNLWLYRRIGAASLHQPGAFGSDISLVNWPQNDYWLGNLHEVSEAEAAHHLERGKQLSLSLLYWMQTEAPRSDGKQGWPGLRLRYDQTGTEDGLAKYPYIRESRRIQAEFTVVEHHVGAEARMKATGKKLEEVTAESFADSVGVGSYRIDLHPSSGGDNYIDVSSLPFQIPLGALLPKRVENLIAAAKNIGVTHITNGCYRLHPVEWNIGESAGCLAAAAVKGNTSPKAFRQDTKKLAAFQASIKAQGIETNWPLLTPR